MVIVQIKKSLPFNLAVMLISISVFFSVLSSIRCNSHAPEDVLPACQTTLKNLQLKYLDLYLVRVYLFLSILKLHRVNQNS